MPISALPFPIAGTIYLVNGVTAVGAGVQVSIRNETSGNTLTTTTDSTGAYMLEAANIEGGYQLTDTITVEVIYQTYEASESVAISDGPVQQDLTLIAVTRSTLLNYFTVQDVWDELGGKTSTDISAARIIKSGQRAEKMIDDRTGTKFISTTVTDEILKFNMYDAHTSVENLEAFGGGQSSRYDNGMNSYARNQIQLKNKPVLTMTSLSINGAGNSAADSWTTLTEQTGSAGDYVVNKDTGWLTFLTNLPNYSVRSIKTSYTYGYSSVPKSVEELAVLLTVRSILLSKNTDSNFTSIDNIQIESIRITKGSASSVMYMTFLDKRIEELWDTVGSLKPSL